MTEKNDRSSRSARFGFLLALSCTLISLGSCGKQGTAQASAAAQTAVETASAGAETTNSAAAESKAAGAESAGSGEGLEAQSPGAERPGEYSVKQSEADQAVAAAEAVAPCHEKEFRANAGKGMAARWTVLDNRDPDGMSLEEFKAYASESVQAEIGAIGDFYLYSFTDKDFETAAGQYMNALTSQLSGIGEISSPEELMQNKTYMQGYWLRIIAVHDMAQGGEIPMVENYRKDLQSILDSYEDAKKAMTPAN